MMLIEKKKICIFLLYTTLSMVDSSVTFEERPNWSLSSGESSNSRSKREVTLQERKNCAPNDVPPVNRVDTHERVQELIGLMKQNTLDAYIIPSADEHQSEYVAEYDQRRAFITGFIGSAGTAIVLVNGKRALWTDGRYFLQADDQMDCQWILMKELVEGVPTILEWLKENLPPNSVVGADPKLVSAQEWISYESSLKESAIAMMSLNTNLVDEIWSDSVRPPRSKSPIVLLELKFAGKSWEDKIREMRMEMTKVGADLMVITAMDENAWLFNLRGGDVPHMPVFRSYTLLDHEKIRLFLDKTIAAEVDYHLHVNQCDQECVEIFDYKSVIQTLRGISSSGNVKKVMLPSKYSYSGGASFAIYSAVPDSKRLMAISPALLYKARKNEIERRGMENAQIKDAVAVTDFLSLLEEEIPEGKYWDELSASAALRNFRAEQKDFHSLSYTTISAFGPNGAIIHYRPENHTNVQIKDNSIYLVDSGGQYKDGTTDITRSLHYGTPTEFQKEVYTRILKGVIDVATLVFPKGTKDTRVDVLARRSLYEVGLDYKHGTGHGIGMFLNIHEAPIQMRIYGDEEHDLEVGHFFSDEPGYYKAGDFGIRLETILQVVQVSTKYESEVPMLGFLPVTLVPYEPKLIDIGLLSRKQCIYLNGYHARVRQVIGPKLSEQGRSRANAYLMEKTEPINCNRAATENTSAGLWQQVANQNMASSIKSSATSYSFQAILCLLLPHFMIVFMLRR